MSAIRTHANATLRTLLMAASVGLLASCGGGGGGGDDDPGGTDASLLPAGGSTNTADGLSTRQIQEIAAASMNNMLSLGSGSASDDMISIFDPEIDSILEGGADAPNILGENVTNSDLNSSLGLNENEVQSISREGNVVTIDLDENELCTPDTSGSDGLAQNAMDQEACESLLQYATVEINAISDDSGVVSYLYRGEPIFRAGYAPNAGSYEFRLDPLLTIAIDQQAYLLEPGDDLIFPQNFSGAYRLSAEADADEPDAIGRIVLELTESLNINLPSENVSITGEPSALLSIGTTETGGSIEFDLAEYRIDAPWDDDLNQSVSYLNPGFSGSIDIRESDGLLTVNNLGVTNGPISLNISSGDAIQFALEQFGFTVSEADGELILTGDLNLNLLIDNTMGSLLDESSVMDFMLSSLAPSGSAMLFSDSGPIQLLRGGPFSVSYTISDGETNEGSTVVVDEGGCFDSASDEAADNGELIELVSCDN